MRARREANVLFASTTMALCLINAPGRPASFKRLEVGPHPCRLWCMGSVGIFGPAFDVAVRLCLQVCRSLALSGHGFSRAVTAVI